MGTLYAKRLHIPIVGVRFVGELRFGAYSGARYAPNWNYKLDRVKPHASTHCAVVTNTYRALQLQIKLNSATYEFKRRKLRQMGPPNTDPAVGRFGSVGRITIHMLLESESTPSTPDTRRLTSWVIILIFTKLTMRCYFRIGLAM